MRKSRNFAAKHNTSLDTMSTESRPITTFNQSGAKILLQIFLVLGIHQLALLAGFYHWYIAGGVLFLGFWMVPKRWWWMLALGVILLTTLSVPLLFEGQPQYEHPFLGFWRSWQQYTFGTVLLPFVAMAGVAWLKYWGDSLDRPADAASITRLHLAVLVSAAMQMLKDLAYVIDDGQVGDVRRGEIVNMTSLGGPHDTQILAQFALSHFIGAFDLPPILGPVATS